jgi:hypothetical protein
VPQHGGPAALREGDAADVRLPAELRAALREWTEVADVVLRTGDPHELDLLRRRGRQLASRVAEVLGRPVRFVDPVSGVVEVVGPPAGVPGGPEGVAGAGGAAGSSDGRNGAAVRDGVGAGVVADPVVADPVVADRVVAGAVDGGVAAAGVAAAGTDAGRGDADHAAGDPGQALAPERARPTPWGPGAAVAAFFAVLVAVADIVLVRAFADTFGLLWLPANLLITAGTVPSLWLARDVPFWRWPAFGAAAGLAAAWVVMLLGLLG